MRDPIVIPAVGYLASLVGIAGMAVGATREANGTRTLKGTPFTIVLLVLLVSGVVLAIAQLA